MSFRLIYVDDSGSDQTNLTVFGWVEVAAPNWHETLRRWLDWRHRQYRSIGLPTDYELHATKFVNGRGNPTGTAWDRRKSHRHGVTMDALRTIGGLPDLFTGAVYRRIEPDTNFHQGKARAYAELVRRLDARLTNDNELGIIIMDGDGSDSSYRIAHRDLKLNTRSLIEDPQFQDSQHSQWVQMADLVAYVAYMHVARIPGKEQMWGWYRDLVAGSAATGAAPQDLAIPQ